MKEKLYKNILILSSILLLLGTIIAVTLPKLMESLIKKQKTLKPNTEIRLMWESFPIPLQFAIYVFNVTNHEDVENGVTPRLQEVGPFVFEEWKDKYNLVDIEAEDAVEYNMRNTYIFRPDLGKSGEELIKMPHPLIQIMAISTKRVQPQILQLIAEGLDTIFKPTSAFIHASFLDIFFKGFSVDCSSDNMAVKAICNNFRTGDVKGVVPHNDTHFTFSLLGASNHSNAGRFKVSRGIKNSRMLGQVLEFEGDKKLNIWPGDECNRIHGTDSTIFPPLMMPSEALWSFSVDLCRSLRPQFQKKHEYNGVPVLRYVMDFGDIENEPSNQCFCTNNSYTLDCPAKGTMDLSLCNKSPMIASMPHFFNGDVKLLEDVEGLEPNEQKHCNFINFEIISGTPLSFAKRLQFNLAVENVKEIPIMSQLKPLVMPLFWIEESLHLDKSLTDRIKKEIFTTKKVVMMVVWNLIIIGLCGLISAGIMLYIRKNDFSQVMDVNFNNSVNN